MFCGLCGNSIQIRYTNRVKEKGVPFYGCTTHRNRKNGLNCDLRTLDKRVTDDAIEKSVLNTIKALANVDEIKARSAYKKSSAKKIKALQDRKSKQLQEIKRCENMRGRLYDDMTRGIISEDEMAMFKESYEKQAVEAKAAVVNIEKEIEKAKNDETFDTLEASIERFKDETKLTRPMVVEFIDKIVLFPDGKIDITFKCADAIQCIADLALNGD
jgi:hypothetical protein